MSGHMDKILVLMVDDNPVNLKVLASLLHGRGWDFSAAGSGEEALRLLETIRPDIMLLDVSMPGLDGFETCRRLKADRRTADLPVIFLTARVEEADILAGFAAGGADYVTKPFRSAELISRIQVHVELRRGRERLARLYEQRNELLHVLCHDLDNPLALVTGYAELLREDASILLQALTAFEHAGNRGREITSIVRSMLAVEEGKIPVGPVDLAEAASAASSSLELRLRDKDVRLDLRVPAGLRVRAERNSLVNSVLGNLLSNALKFSRPGSEIALHASEAPDGVHLTCRDHGVGMPPALLAVLFDPGKPTSRPGTKGERGTGFGMPLMRKFVEAYGGRIEVRSREEGPGEADPGTEVEIVLPRV